MGLFSSLFAVPLMRIHQIIWAKFRSKVGKKVRRKVRKVFEAFKALHVQWGLWDCYRFFFWSSLPLHWQSMKLYSKSVHKAVSASKSLSRVSHYFVLIDPLHLRRCRYYKPEVSPYEVVPNTLNTLTNHITLDIVNKENDHIFVLKLEGLKVSRVLLSAT